MTLRREWKPLFIIAAGFAVCYWLPVELLPVSGAIGEALKLLRWYAREHVLTCLVPAFFIAGAIAVFISKAAVMRYLGAGANKVVAYGVAAVSGTILAVCSCTVLPLFAGIYGMGAGLGPATVFLYSGPAINVLAIILTARVLGVELGLARAIGAIVFSVVIGLLMHLAFIREERLKAAQAAALPVPEAVRPLWQAGLYFAAMVAVLIFANWGGGAEGGFFAAVYEAKWLLTAGAGLLLGVMLVLWFKAVWWEILLVALVTAATALVWPAYPAVPFSVSVIGLAVLTVRKPGELREWTSESWVLAKQIMPLLFAGVLVAGLLLGTPQGEGLIPSGWVADAVGGNSVGANLFAAVAGALMYFATLTEVPILEGLISGGMGSGPALALLLAGPALSLPNMLVIARVMGWRKTLVFCGLVVFVAAASGLVYGSLFS
jgi:uncharacterized membrane protein YraQ (UPF0718 family)